MTDGPTAQSRPAAWLRGAFRLWVCAMICLYLASFADVIRLLFAAAMR